MYQNIIWFSDCTTNPCQTGETCITLKDSGYWCTCPANEVFNTALLRCEEIQAEDILGKLIYHQQL